MTNTERHQQRAAIAARNGYRPTALPDHPEWAGRRLPESIDEAAATAARKLRGLPSSTAPRLVEVKKAS